MELHRSKTAEDYNARVEADNEKTYLCKDFIVAIAEFDDDEEIDPLNERFKPTKQPIDNIEIKYCPYCGNKLAKDFEYCPSCGKKIPD